MTAEELRRSGTIYAALALSALLLSFLWQGLSFPATTPQLFGIHSYRIVIGQLDGRSCPSYPVCSLYARQALTEHGWLIGSWMIIDRLIHESDDLHRGPWVEYKGERRLYDPLSRNDFWLKEGKDETGD